MNPLVQIINQVFEIRHKITEAGNAASFERNFNRLNSILEEAGFIVQDPTGEAYLESRTDCEASISGSLAPKMKIVKTLKPVVYKKEGNTVQLVQKAVVIVEKS
ncbi:MAG: hypothetical protein U0V75_03115 [Ferruginibacter sp.]